MDSSMKNSLCRGLRASGIPRKQANQLLNEIQKWDRENGPEWTVSRIKALRQWYETVLAGKPEPPEWFKRTRTGLPVGIWNWVFKLPKAKALAVLSSSTIYYEKTMSEKQKEKFFHGLYGNGTQNLENVKSLVHEMKGAFKVYYPFVNFKFSSMPDMVLPTIFDMNGSCPVHDGSRTMRANGDIGAAMEILQESWLSVPQVTFDFLIDQDKLDWIPIDVAGNSYQLELQRPHTKIVGRISVIQEPELKARVVANPNRVTQVTLDPLKMVYMTTIRHLRSSGIFDQESGMRWVQNQLVKGTTLAGSDLTSASDLLDLDASLYLVDQVFGFSRIHGYQDYVNYFRQVSRSEWACSFADGPVRWNQGDPLGTVPSIGLLDLTNAAAALCAIVVTWRRYPNTRRKGETPLDLFRTIGDDMIMDARFAPVYNDVISALGGEVNLTKTLISDKVAEFAGRVITPSEVLLKKINYSEPSDNSFMSYMAQLGDQAKYFLRPKQRAVYDLLKEVPGILVQGPWSKDSYGIPLELRYQWYLEEVKPVLDRVDPDLDLKPYGMLLLKASYEAEMQGRPIDIERKLPWPMEESYLDSLLQAEFRHGGDPRLVNGKTLLDALHKHLENGSIMPFPTWLDERHPGLANKLSRSGARINLADEQDCPTLLPSDGHVHDDSRGEDR